MKWTFSCIKPTFSVHSKRRVPFLHTIVHHDEKRIASCNFPFFSTLHFLDCWLTSYHCELHWRKKHFYAWKYIFIQRSQSLQKDPELWVIKRLDKHFFFFFFISPAFFSAAETCSNIIQDYLILKKSYLYFRKWLHHFIITIMMVGKEKRMDINLIMDTNHHLEEHYVLENMKWHWKFVFFYTNVSYNNIF